MKDSSRNFLRRNVSARTIRGSKSEDNTFSQKTPRDHFNHLEFMYHNAQAYKKAPASSMEYHRLRRFRLEYENSLNRCKWLKNGQNIWERRKFDKFFALLDVLQTLEDTGPISCIFQSKREKAKSQEKKNKQVQEKLSDIERVFRKKTTKIAGYEDNAVKRIRSDNPHTDATDVCVSDYTNSDATKYYDFKKSYAMKRAKDKKRKKSAKKAHFQSLCEDIRKTAPIIVKSLATSCLHVAQSANSLQKKLKERSKDIDFDNILDTGISLKDFVMLVSSLASINWSNKYSIILGLIPVVDRIQPDLFTSQYQEVLFRLIGSGTEKMKVFFTTFLDFLTSRSSGNRTFFQSDDGSVDSLDWRSFIHSDVAVYGFRLLTFLVTSKNLRAVDIKWCGIEFFAVKAQKTTVKATELIDCLFSLFSSIMVGLRRYIQTGNFCAMFSSESVEAKAGELLSYMTYAKTKILFAKTGLTEDHYLTELQKVKRKLESRIHSEERFKPMYVTLLNRVQNSISDLGKEGIRQGAKMHTFGILLVGGSSVGKSWISSPLLDYALRCNDLPAEPENKAVINSSCKHDDTITNATRGINFDDLSTRKANSSSEMCDEERVMQMHNNVTYPANKASLEEKSSTMMNILMDIGSTNSEFLNAIELMKCPEAVLRRWQMHVTQVPRPEFRKPGTTMLDPNKVKAYFGSCQWPDAWEFRIRECISIEPSKKGGKTFKMLTIDPENGRDYYNIKEFLLKIKEMSGKHFELERESLKSRTTVVEINDDTGLPKDMKIFNADTYLVPSQVTTDFQSDPAPISETVDENESITEVEVQVEGENDEENVNIENVESLANCFNFLHYTAPFIDLTKVPPSIRRLWVASGGDVVLFCAYAFLGSLFVPIMLSIFFGFLGNIVALAFFCIEALFILDYVRFLIQEMIANSVGIHRMHRLYNKVSLKVSETTTKVEKCKHIFSSAFLVYGVYRWYVSRDKPSGKEEEDPKASFQSLDDKKEERQRKDPYLDYRGKKPFNETTATMVSEDFFGVVAKSQCIINVSDVSGHVNNCKGHFVEDRILCIPRHVFEPLDDTFTLEIFYNEFHKDEVIFDKRNVKGRQIWQLMGQENVLLHLTDVRSFGKKKMQEYYGSEKLVTPAYSANLLTMDVKTFKKQRFDVYSIEDERYACSICDENKETLYSATIDGYTAKYDGIEPVKGMCGALVVSSFKPHVILGVHNAADTNGNAKICPIVKEEIAVAIVRLIENSFYTQVDTVNSYDFHSNSVKSPRVHHLNACNEFSTYTAVDIFGDIGRSGNTKFTTKETPMRDEVLKLFDVSENPYTVPPSKGTQVDGVYKDPWINLVNELNICSSSIPQSHLQRAHNIALIEIDALLEEYIADDDTLKRVISIDEAINGIPKIKAANGIKMSTSAGPKYGGKKSSHMANGEYPYIPEPYVIKDVEDKIEKYSKNETTDTVFKFCLKDEAIKRSKAEEFRTRAFSALPLDSVIAFNMFYAASCSFLYNNPIETGCAISLDPSSYDQDRIHNKLVDDDKFLDENGVIIDFKAFDKTLPQSLIRKQWDKHVHIAKRFGFSKDQITVMQAIAEEQVAPVCLLNGAKVKINFTHASGNGATSQIGSSAGKDVVRAAIIAIAEDLNIVLSDNEVIGMWRSVHMGDDLKSTVHKDYKWFNFLTLQSKLAEWNITITMPDKTSEPTKFQSVKAHDFLKRLEHFCPLRNSYVGRLDESSLMKCLLFYLPSKTEEKEAQLGQMFAAVIDEYALYEKEKYDKFLAFANEMKSKYRLKIYNSNFSYEYQVVRWIYEQSKLHKSYKERRKPQLTDLLSCCDPEPHWVSFFDNRSQANSLVECFFQSNDTREGPNSDSAPEFDEEPRRTYTWSTHFRQEAGARIYERKLAWQQEANKFYVLILWVLTQFCAGAYMKRFGNPYMILWGKWHFVWYKKIFGRQSWFARICHRPDHTWRGTTYFFVTCLYPAMFSLFFVMSKILSLTMGWLVNMIIEFFMPDPDKTQRDDFDVLVMIDLVEEYFPWVSDQMFHKIRARYQYRLRQGATYEELKEEFNGLYLEFQDFKFKYEQATKSYDPRWIKRIQCQASRKMERRMSELGWLEDPTFEIPQMYTAFQGSSDRVSSHKKETVRTVSQRLKNETLGTTSSPIIEVAIHSDGVQGKDLRESVVDYHSPTHCAAIGQRRHTLLTAFPTREIPFSKTASSARNPGSNELSNPKRIKELTNTQTQKNVDFNITNTGFTKEAEIGSDPSMKAAGQPDLSLSDFPMRPVKIAELVWSSSAWNFDEINPWEELLSNPTVARKLANFKLMKAKLVLDFITNGSPYLSGRGMFYYNPLHTQDNFRPSNVDDRLCRISQRPHIYIDPTNSSGGTIELPFIWPKNAVNIPNKEWQQLGVLNFIGISDLRHSNGETPYVNVTVMAHLENLELYQTTETTISEFQSESKKVVSRAATAVGNIAGQLASAPVIGPYARATEEVARTVGNIAQVLGFSKPNIGPGMGVVKTTKFGTLAPTNDYDTSTKLTLDCKNETTIDPAVTGLSSRTEMTLPEIVNKECLLTRLRWDITDDPDTELLRIPITPYIRSTFPDDNKIDLPPCAYMSTFFQHWRGTMEYEFDIICSKFHRGKLSVRVEPHGTSGRNDYNVTEREIFDITETTQHGIAVGWSSDRNYLSISSEDKQPFTPNESPNLDYHNGVIVLSVSNNLQRPSETAETFVEILVRVRASKDMQFNIPHSRTLEKIQMLEDTGLTEPTPVPPTQDNIYPHPGNVAKSNFKMGVYYYGWHVPNFNNNEGYVRKFLVDSNGDPEPHLPLVVGRNPAGEEYDDRQRDVTRKQFDVMLKAGIDFVVCSWWGNGSRTDIQFETAALPECGSTAHGHMRACVHYETATLKNIGNGYNWTTAVRDRVRSDMAKVKASYSNDVDRYLFRVDHDGVHTKPVVFLYLFRSMSDSFKRSICDEINDVFSNSSYPGANYAGAFIVGDYIFGSAKTLPIDIQDKIGAITAYDVYGQTVGGTTKADINSVHQYHDRISEYRSLAPNIETFPTISPSYNDRGVRIEEDHIALDRALSGYDKGSLLKLHLEDLQRSAAKLSGTSTLTGMCIINSWNEWHEETTIEPCVGNGNGVGPMEYTQGIEYEPYGTKYVNLVGEFMVPSYTAQSDNTDLGEAQEEHNHEMTTHKQMLQKQKTYANDDLIYHGERVASIGMMLSRFELTLKVNTASTGVTRLFLPAVPYYEVDRDDVSGGTFYETNINRLSVLFLTRRGSMRWKVLNDFHNTTPRIAAVKLEEYSKLELLGNEPSNNTLADGWSGMAAVTGVYDPVLEWEVPYYSNERFHIARNLDRSKEIGHSHVYDTTAVYRNYYLVAAGEDFTLSYFLGTPSIVVS